jgi:hypothetical protein
MKLFPIMISMFIAFSVAGPVSWYGALTTSGNKIKSSDGSQDVQLKGPSLYWSTFVGSLFYNEETVNWFVDTMDISVIRAAMAVKYWDNDCSRALDDGDRNYGYLSNSTKWPLATSKANQIELIDKVVQAAILNDIYVIIDWHSHCAHRSDESGEAATFFENMANKYKGVPNVIFEIYNEPTTSVGWSQVNSYATNVISKIRGTGNNNHIIVGSPSWSSNPNECASGMKSQSNISCALHFYAGTHSGSGSSQLSNGNSALSSGVPVFVSEWGTVNADGAGSPNSSSSQAWITWMNNNKVSSCKWNASSLNEGSSIWDSTQYARNGMSVAALSNSGRIFYGFMGGNGTTTLGKTNPPTGYPYGRSTTASVQEGQTKTWTLAELGANSGETLQGFTQPGVGTVAASGTGFAYTAPAVSNTDKTTFHYTLSRSNRTSKHRITVKILRPIRTSLDEINVSYKAASSLDMSRVGASSPDNKSLTFTSQSVSGGGTVSRASDSKSLTYTPASNASKGSSANLTFTVTDGANSATKTIKMNLINMPPSGNSQLRSIPNTAPFSWSLNGAGNGADANLPNSDPEGDPLTIAEVLKSSGDPGTITISADKRTLTYTPASGMKSGGKPVIVYKLSDGESIGTEGRITLTITGSGSDIGTITPPGSETITSIKPQIASNFGVEVYGKNLSVHLAQSGSVSLDVYSISGVKAVSLMSGFANAGSYEFSLGNLKKGVYIVRFKQGSDARVLRVVR